MTHFTSLMTEWEKYTKIRQNNPFQSIIIKVGAPVIYTLFLYSPSFYTISDQKIVSGSLFLTQKKFFPNFFKFFIDILLFNFLVLTLQHV